MTIYPLTDFLFPKVERKLKNPDQIDEGFIPLSEFDFRKKTIVRDEAFFNDLYPDLPKGAAFALAKVELGMKAKQIRSEYKKYIKKLAFIKQPIILTFD